MSSSHWPVRDCGCDEYQDSSLVDTMKKDVMGNASPSSSKKELPMRMPGLCQG